MMKKNIFISLIFLLFIAAPITAQEEQPAAEKPAAAQPVATQTAQPKKAAVPRQQAQPQTGLLPVEDGNYKYARIPELTPAAPEKHDTVIDKLFTDKQETIDSNIQTETEDASSGIFGLSVRVVNIIIRVFVVVLIVGLIVIYWKRSKKRRKVFYHSNKRW